MQIPLQITFRDLPPSDAIEARVRSETAKLERYFDRITACRVVIEAPHRRHHKGKLYHVRVDITLPGGTLVIDRERHARHAHEDVYVAIRDTFQAAQRQLRSHARKRRGEVKQHETPPHGRIVRLFPGEGYGFIGTPDEREIYFHRNAVVNESFDQLEVGVEVRFVQVQGDDGPQASTVTAVGKHHIVA